MDFKVVSQDRLAVYAGLFSSCFPHAASLRSTGYLKWLYVDNPEGMAIGFDAFDGERLAAHYVCIPVSVRIRGRNMKAMLSINTATHPDYQGQGLFTRLAEMTYEYAAEKGINAVYGIANRKSTPGFTRKLGFQLVSHLDSWVGFGRLGVCENWDKIYAGTEFRRIWPGKSIRWRMSNPVNPVFADSSEDGLTFTASAGMPCVSVYSETGKLDPETEKYSARCRTSSGRGLKVFLGLFPERTLCKKSYISIPEAVRPSSLNLVYRNLVKSDDRLNPDGILLNFLDFDAF